MTSGQDDECAPIRVVLADANVLYSRVLRDYLLYAATQGVMEIRWSAAILAEVVEHLAENIAELNAEAGARLVAAMNGAFPAAEVKLDGDAEAAVAELPLPDEGDRHVLAAAVTVCADVLCTNNVKDFPLDVMTDVGIRLMSADALLSLSATEFPGEMLAAHQLVVSRFPGATDGSTLAALRRAGAMTMADLMFGLLRN